MESSKNSVVPTPPAVVLSEAVREAARRLELGPIEIGQIIGVSEPTAACLLSGQYLIKDGATEWALSAMLVRVYVSLHTLVGSDDALARDWLYGPNKGLGGAVPIVLLGSKGGLLRVAGYLDQAASHVDIAAA